MKQSIVHVALLVRDYDEAIAFYTNKLYFTVVEDTYQQSKINDGYSLLHLCRCKIPTARAAMQIQKLQFSHSVWIRFLSQYKIISDLTCFSFRSINCFHVLAVMTGITRADAATLPVSIRWLP
jgi:hypothetical protein